MLTQVQKLIKVSELRRNLSKYLSQSASEPVVVSAGRSEGSRVLLDSELFNKLVEMYEDHQDAEMLKALVAENHETVSWKEVKGKNCP